MVLKYYKYDYYIEIKVMFLLNGSCFLGNVTRGQGYYTVAQRYEYYFRMVKTIKTRRK